MIFTWHVSIFLVIDWNFGKTFPILSFCAYLWGGWVKFFRWERLLFLIGTLMRVDWAKYLMSEWANPSRIKMQEEHGMWCFGKRAKVLIKSRRNSELTALITSSLCVKWTAQIITWKCCKKCWEDCLGSLFILSWIVEVVTLAIHCGYKIWPILVIFVPILVGSQSHNQSGSVHFFPQRETEVSKQTCDWTDKRSHNSCIYWQNKPAAHYLPLH